MNQNIEIQTTINSPIDIVWDAYTNPVHIVNWNHASDDWHTPKAENDLRTGGKFNYRMESKDGKFGFDFGGVYDEVTEKALIKYTLGDGRKVQVQMNEEEGKTKINITFEMEKVNSAEKQREGWQAILNNFKNYVEKIAA